MTVLGQTQFEKYHIFLDSNLDHDEEGYYTDFEIRVLEAKSRRYGPMWMCERIIKFGRQRATGDFVAPQPIREKANKKFKTLSRKLLKDGTLDLSKIRNDE